MSVDFSKSGKHGKQSIKIARINAKHLEAIAPGESRDVFVWDTELKGFALRIRPNSRRSYILQYRNADGRSRRMKIGDAEVLTPDEARRQAGAALKAVAAGDDPVAERKAKRGSHLPNVSDVADRYIKEHAKIHKKPRSAAEDERMVEAYVKPRLGTRRIDHVGREHIAALHRSMVDTPYMANRVWALLSKMFNVAEEWGLRPEGSNPCRRIKRYPEKSRVRYLTPAELKRFGEAITAAEKEEEPKKAITPTTALAIRLLVLTGCRLREILNLTWDQVDLEHRVIRLPDSKTGRRAVSLGAPAVQLLEHAPRYVDSPFVLPGHIHGRPLTTLRPGWGLVIKRGKLPDLRPHDLRHAFASVAAVGGESLLVIGAMLGHTETETTRKYAHLTADPVRDATDRTAAAIAKQLGLDEEPETEADNVVPLRRPAPGAKS